MTEITELLERVKAATGPDREIDAAIFVALVEPTWCTSPKDPGAVAADKKYFWPDGKIKYHTRNSKFSLQYTASVDAALALVERVLPGVEVSMKLNHPMHDWQTATIASAPLKHASGEEKTLPLAIIAALLTAIIAQAEP